MALKMVIPGTFQGSMEEQYVVFSDFDGTITQKDSTVELINKYGGEVNRRMEELYAAGKAHNREVISLHYDTLNLSVKDYYGVIRSMPIDPSFQRFYETLARAGIELHVVTGSTTEGVTDYFHMMGFANITVHGNRLQFKNGRVSLFPADKTEDTLCGEGFCANCKSARIEKYHRRNKKVIYIGDGLTDTCASNHADLLFAKDDLARYCAERKINFVPFDSFDDIHQYLLALWRQ